MQKLLAQLFFIINFSIGLTAQNSFHFGVQSGLNSSSYFYSSTLPKTKSAVIFDGTVGPTVTFLHNAFLVETGIFGIYSRPPYFVYNTISSSFSVESNKNGSTLDLIYIPIRFGYNFSALKNRLTISPKLGLGVYHSLNGTGNTNIWANGVDDISLIISGNIPEDPGVTIGYGYRPYKNVLAVDASILLSYSIHKFLQLNFNVIATSTQKPLYYENIKHFGQTQTVYATSTQTGLTISSTIGFAFTIPFNKEQEVEE